MHPVPILMRNQAVPARYVLHLDSTELQRIEKSLTFVDWATVQYPRLPETVDVDQVDETFQQFQIIQNANNNDVDQVDENFLLLVTAIFTSRMDSRVLGSENFE